MRILTSLLVVGALGGPALADNKAADAQFKKGKALLAEKRYSDACAAFEKSNSLEPGIGAKLNVAKCYEEWGKLATALKWYRDAEKMATEAKDPRAAKIHELVETVDGDTPRLTLRTAVDADRSVTVTLDGAPATFDEALEVDPGAHIVDYTGENREHKRKVIPVERGGTSEVKLDLPRRKPKKSDKPDTKVAKVETPETPQPIEPPDPGRTRRFLGIGVGASGVVAIGVASYLTITARGTYKDALSAHCGGSSTACDPEGLKITHDARHKANIATIVFSLGAVAVAGGVVLYLTAPTKSSKTEKSRETDEAWYLAPAIDDQGGGIVFGGSY